MSQIVTSLHSLDVSISSPLEEEKEAKGRGLESGLSRSSSPSETSSQEWDKLSNLDPTSS